MSDVLSFWQVAEVDTILFKPLSPRFQSGYLRLYFVIVDQPTANRVNQEHLARLKSTLSNHLCRMNVGHSGLRGKNHEAVLSY